MTQQLTREVPLNLTRRQRWAKLRRQTTANIKKSCFEFLGPGMIAGASDDDPSGIATYSQAGAKFGMSMLWMMPLSLPLMVAIQEISARIGRVTGRGIARNMRLNYPVWVVFPVITCLVVANVINLAADLSAMGAALKLLIPGPLLLYSVLFGLLSISLQVFIKYQTYTRMLKWGAVALFVYVITAFVIHADWLAVLHATVIPTFPRKDQLVDYISVFVAVMGTTISPYLFFWQASLESEETKITPGDMPLVKAPEQAREQFRRIRLDTAVGMIVSNVIAFFIILDTAVTLNSHGITDVGTAEQAALALKPLAGQGAFLLFALGIIGGGLLAIPVLSGSVAYAVGELFHWPVGMERTPSRAKGFYSILAIATFIGLLINFFHLDPLKALFWSAVINGIASVPVMILIMLMFHSRKIMGRFVKTSRLLKTFGWIATGVMTAATIGFFATLGH